MTQIPLFKSKNLKYSYSYSGCSEWHGTREENVDVVLVDLGGKKDTNDGEQSNGRDGPNFNKDDGFLAAYRLGNVMNHWVEHKMEHLD